MGSEVEPREGYFDHARSDICDLVVQHSPVRLPRVLDLGSGSGRLGEALKVRGIASLVHGIELNGPAAELAGQRLDRVWAEDLSRFDWSKLALQYDVVIAADILEHLADPWKTLRQVRRVLAPNGRVIASIPNIRYWKVIADLLVRGEFRYVEEGVLDRTHLRFFTRASIARLFRDIGFEIEFLGPKPAPRRGWRRVVMAMAGDFGHVQYHVVASGQRHSPPGSPHRPRGEVAPKP